MTAAMMVVVHAGRPVQRRRIRPIRTRPNPTPQPAPDISHGIYSDKNIKPRRSHNSVISEGFYCTECRRTPKPCPVPSLPLSLSNTVIPLSQHRLAVCSTPIIVSQPMSMSAPKKKFAAPKKSSSPLRVGSPTKFNPNVAGKARRALF